MGAQHGFLRCCPGLSQWESEDLRQEPSKGGRTRGQGQGLLLDVAAVTNGLWSGRRHLPVFFRLQHMSMHTASFSDAHNAYLSTSDKFSRTECFYNIPDTHAILKTCIFKLTHAISKHG